MIINWYLPSSAQDKHNLSLKVDLFLIFVYPPSLPPHMKRPPLSKEFFFKEDFDYKIKIWDHVFNETSDIVRRLAVTVGTNHMGANGKSL